MEVCGYRGTARAPPQPWGVPGFAPAVRMLRAAMEPLCTRSIPLRGADVLLSLFPTFCISNIIQKQLQLTRKQFWLSGWPGDAGPSRGIFSDRVPSAGPSWFVSSGAASSSHVCLITAFHFDTTVTSVASI